jgi:uncharacterized protein
MASERTRCIEVVYATPDSQHVVAIPHRDGLTAERAVELSGLLERCPEIREHPLVLGVFGTRVGPDRVLAPGDRVEICRPLLRDPRDRRRELTKPGRA